MSFDHDPELSWQMRRLRIAAKGMRSSQAGGERLMARFAAQHPPSAKLRRVWAWPAAIAAAVLLSVAVMRTPKPAPVEPVVFEEGMETTDGFIAVPFVPPLAQGESTHIVHTELHPAALAGLGLNVDPAWATSMPADLLVGEDGFPRAVRVSNEDSGGF